MAENYIVNNIYKTVGVDKRGNFIDVYEVSYTMSGDIVSTVKIPGDMFSKEEVKRVIEEEVDNILKVLEL